MKLINNSIKLVYLVFALFILAGCNNLLNEPAENRAFTKETDYTKSENMNLPSSWLVFRVLRNAMGRLSTDCRSR